jgi:hypothetical protein
MTWKSFLWPSQIPHCILEKEHLNFRKLCKKIIDNHVHCATDANHRKASCPFWVDYGVLRHFQFYWWRKPEYPKITCDRSVASHWKPLSDNVVSSTPRYEWKLNSRLYFSPILEIQCIDFECTGSLIQNRVVRTKLVITCLLLSVGRYFCWYL